MKGICPSCHKTGKPQHASILVGFLLMLFLILPGVLWLMYAGISNGKKKCPFCSTPNMVPLDSPVGLELLALIADPDGKQAYSG